MKINVEIDCTPEEARRAVGLPDLTPLHDRYVATLMEMMEGKVRPDTLEAMMKGWAPVGEAGMAMWRHLFDPSTKSGGG